MAYLADKMAEYEMYLRRSDFPYTEREIGLMVNAFADGWNTAP